MRSGRTVHSVVEAVPAPAEARAPREAAPAVGPARPREGGRRPWKAALRLGLSVLLIVVIVRSLGGESLARALAGTRLAPWLLTLLAFLFLHACSALKWRAFLAICGNPIRAGMALRCHFSGLCANLFLPSLVGGDVVRAGVAFGSAASKEAVVLGSLIDRVSDTLALAALASAGLLVLSGSGRLQECLGAGIDPRLVVGLLLAALVLGFGGMLIGLRLLRSRRLPRRIRRIAVRLLRSVRAAQAQWPRVAAGVVAAILIQGGLLAASASLAGSMGVVLEPALWLLLWPLAKVAAMLPISAGGLGVREAAFAGLAATFGVPPEGAVAQSLVWQSVLMAGGILGGIAWIATRTPRDPGTAP